MCGVHELGSECSLNQVTNKNSHNYPEVARQLATENRKAKR